MDEAIEQLRQAVSSRLGNRVAGFDIEQLQPPEETPPTVILVVDAPSLSRAERLDLRKFVYPMITNSKSHTVRSHLTIAFR